MQLPYITKIIFNKTKPGKGFRLINLLVIFGILAGNTSLALSQSSNDPSVEAKQNIGAFLRAQQAYFLENSVFANSIPDLGTGIPTTTFNYQYVVVRNNNPNLPSVTHQARPYGVIRTRILGRTYTYGPGRRNKAVIGGVVSIQVGAYLTTLSKSCTANLTPQQGGPLGTELMIFSPTGLSCPNGYK
jgi:type II secretory pathway pseudopilin PulG